MLKTTAVAKPGAFCCHVEYG